VDIFHFKKMKMRSSFLLSFSCDFQFQKKFLFPSFESGTSGGTPFQKYPFDQLPPGKRMRVGARNSTPSINVGLLWAPAQAAMALPNTYLEIFPRVSLFMVTVTDAGSVGFAAVIA